MDMNKAMSKIERGVAKGLCIVLFLYVICGIIHMVISFDPIAAYSNYNISEYMINFQGGFVRRGVTGELLYQIFQIHPFPLSNIILWFDIAVFIIFIIVAFRVFNKKHYIPIMPLAILTNHISWYRRDFLMLLFAFTIFYLMFQYLQKKKCVFLVCSILLSSISILIYEPSFFFVIPISMFLYWKSLDKNKKTIYCILNTLAIFAITLICMVAVCMTKGSEDIANVIWHSWQPLFDYQGIISETPGAAVNFLGKSTLSSIKMHLNLNYGITKSGFSPLLAIGSLLMFVCTYYLVVKTPTYKSQSKGHTTLLSDMYIFQFICLLPMFTILSCDFGRTINYVIYTSLFLTYLMEKYQTKYNPPFIHNFSKNVCRLYNNNVISSFWLYIIVLFIMPFKSWGGVSILHPLIMEYIDLFLKILY